MNKKLFLRVYELRKKFRHQVKKFPQNENVIQRDISAWVEVGFNGFDIVWKLTENERKELLKAIDIVYKPVWKLNQIINCCLTNAYRTISDLKKE